MKPIHFLYLFLLLFFFACNENSGFDMSTVENGGFAKTETYDRAIGADGEFRNSEGNVGTYNWTVSATDNNGAEIISGSTGTNQSNVPNSKQKNAKMIWSANLEYQVNNVDSATLLISQIAANNDGYVSDMAKSETDRRINNSITIKVNSANFQNVINQAKALSIHLNHEKITSKDVTKEFIDVESRLKTKREVLERYKDILRKNTGKIEEVLKAEEAIRKLTEEIEAKEGQLRYLKDRVNFSRIHLKIYEKVEFMADAPERYEVSFGNKAKAGFGNGWSIIQNFILILITLWPILLIISAILFWKRNWIRKTFKTS